MPTQEGDGYRPSPENHDPDKPVRKIDNIPGLDNVIPPGNDRKQQEHSAGCYDDCFK